MSLSFPRSTRRSPGFHPALLLGLALSLWTAGCASESAIPTLNLRGANGQAQVVSSLGELPSLLDKTTTAGEWRLAITGRHELRSPVRLKLRPGQRLVIEGEGPDAGFELAQVPPDKSAISLDAGSFEVRGLTLRHGPRCCIEIEQGVSYHLSRLHVLDARGGGIAVWGPLGVDQDGPKNNVIEHCLIERFNLLDAKWKCEGISLRDNQALITGNVVRDSLTETMGIHARGAGNRIESNLVQNVSIRDSGAIYLSAGERIYTAVGNIVRHNVVVGAQRGVYLDDGTCAAVVEQNYLVDCRDFAVCIGGGRDNLVRQNLALRTPVFAHLDNRRTGWPALPDKAKMFSDARARLKTALGQKTVRDRLTAAGFNVEAFQNNPEAAFNQPEGNRVISNVLMPPAQMVRWQNFAKPKEPLADIATDPTSPNHELPASVTDWQQLSGQSAGIQGMPDVAELLKGVGSP